VSIVPLEAMPELGLEFRGYAPMATGGGLISLPFYVANVQAFNKNFDLRIGALDLPKEGGIGALIGRDMLDTFKICLNGKKQEIEVSDP